MKKQILLHFILSITSSVCGPVKDNVLFKIKSIEDRHIDAKIPGDAVTRDIIKKHPFHQLTYEKLQKMCDDAVDNALENAVPLRRINIQAKVDKFMISDDSEQPSEQIAILCPTQPFIILRLLEEETSQPMLNLQIIVHTNPFFDKKYKVNVQMVKSAKQLNGVDLDPILQRNYLSRWHKFRRWQMCIAARDRIRPEYEVTLHQISTTEDWPELVGFYDFILHPDGTELKSVVAFSCSSSPKMYVRTARENSRKDFIIMVEGDETRKENFVSKKTPQSSDSVFR